MLAGNIMLAGDAMLAGDTMLVIGRSGQLYDITCVGHSTKRFHIKRSSFDLTVHRNQLYGILCIYAGNGIRKIFVDVLVKQMVFWLDI